MPREVLSRYSDMHVARVADRPTCVDGIQDCTLYVVLLVAIPGHKRSAVMDANSLILKMIWVVYQRCWRVQQTEE